MCWAGLTADSYRLSAIGYRLLFVEKPPHEAEGDGGSQEHAGEDFGGVAIRCVVDWKQRRRGRGVAGTDVEDGGDGAQFGGERGGALLALRQVRRERARQDRVQLLGDGG